MKTTIAAMLCLLSAATAAVAQGPVGYWRGDDGAAPTTALDSSGNGRNATYLGGATTLATPLPPGLFQNASAFALNGTSAELSVPHNAAFNLVGDMTVAFWMRKTSEAGDWQRLVGKGSSNVRTFGVWEESGAANHILFQQYNGSGGAVVSFLSTGTVGLDTWTHVACTVAGNTCTIYLAGAPSGTATRSAAPAVDTEPLTFAHGPIHTFFPGQLDEIRLYNRALSAAEVQTLAGLTPLAAPALGGAASASQVDLTWTAVAGAASYTIQRAPAAAGPWTTLAAGVTALSYADTTVNVGTTYFYSVYAVGLVDGPSSSPALQIVVPLPPPRTEDHEEGLLGNSCSCGASTSGPAPAWALLALLALRSRRRVI